MTGRREILRQRAQMRRDIKKAVATQETKVRRAQIGAIVDKVRIIVSGEQFASIAKSLGISSFPKCLTNEKNLLIDDQRVNLERSEDVLHFIIAWKFMAPLLQQAVICNHLNEKWPGFIESFKDVFIALVTNGPFPEERKTAMRQTFFR